MYIEKDSRTAKRSSDDGIKQFSIQPHTYLSHYTCIMWIGDVRWDCIPSCFMPSSLLVSLRFAVLLSLHLHTVFFVFCTCIMSGFSSSFFGHASSNLADSLMNGVCTKQWHFTLSSAQPHCFLTASKSYAALETAH